MSEIRIPYKDVEDHVLTIAGLARTLPEGERETVRELVTSAVSEGDHLVSDFLSRFERVGPEQRRAMVDRARAKAGEPTVAEVEGKQRFEMTNRALRAQRDSEGRILQNCHAAGCNAVPLDERGWPVPVTAARWFCESHIDQAAPGDMDPPLPRYVVDGLGRLLPVGEELERLEAEDRKTAEEDREHREDRQREGEAIAAVRERYLEQAEPQVWSGVKVKPGGEIVRT